MSLLLSCYVRPEVTQLLQLCHVNLDSAQIAARFIQHHLQNIHGDCSIVTRLGRTVLILVFALYGQFAAASETSAFNNAAKGHVEAANADTKTHTRPTACC